MNKTWTLAPALSYSALNLPYSDKKKKKEDLKNITKALQTCINQVIMWVYVCVCLYKPM